MRLLVVDDEEPIVELVAGYASREGWQVLRAYDGEQALAIAKAERPDVVVLDLMLPGIDGIEVARALRTFSTAGLIMLTAKSEEIDKIVGLAVGADDYVVKPFSPRELVARIKAIARRQRSAVGQATLPGLDVDRVSRQARVDGRKVDLTRTEFDILAALVEQPGAAISRPELLGRVWGAGYTDDHLVDVHVANLRHKLGDEPARPRFIETVRGVGYRLMVG